MVQLGNEINPGLLWAYSATWTGCSSADDGAGGTRTVCHTENWDHLARLLTAGYGAVKRRSPSTKVMLHLAEGGNNGTFRWWFDNVTTRNVPFDVIGASFYGYWHGSLGAAPVQPERRRGPLRQGRHRRRDGVPVHARRQGRLGEHHQPPSELVPGYPATPEGQAAQVRDVMSIVRAVPGGRGLGVFYWEATWTGVPGNGWSPRDPTSGNAWENQALFDFDDRPLPAMREFRP